MLDACGTRWRGTRCHKGGESEREVPRKAAPEPCPARRTGPTLLP